MSAPAQQALFEATAPQVPPHTERTLFAVNHSGGKDSQAMLITLLKMGIDPRQMLVVHAALGEIEWPGALELARDQATSAGIEFVVARSRRTLFDMVRDRFERRPEVPSWPSASNRQCTSDLKRGPCTREIRRYASAHGFTEVYSCFGFRAEESPARAKRPTLQRIERNCTRQRDWWDWSPIHQLTVDEVFSTIRDAGQEPHWAYAEGNDRLSCTFCILASTNDLRVGARMRPELLREYIALEDLTGYTMHQSRVPLREIVA